MSEMQGIEQKQAETTKGIAATTAAIKDMSSKNEESNTGIKAGLNAIVKGGLIESKADKIARKATQRAAIDAAAHYAEMQKLAAEGNASAEDLAAAQDAATKTAAEAAEAEEKQSMLDRFGNDKGPDVGPADDAKKTGGTIKKYAAKLGALSLLLLGLLGLLLNTPAFEVISKALDDLIDWFDSPNNPLTKFFKEVIDGIGDLFKGDFKKGFLKIGKAFDDALTTAIKSAFGVEFEGSVASVIGKFVGDFLAGLANLLPDFDVFKGAKAALLKAAAAIDPKRKAAMEAQKKREEETKTLLQDLGQEVKLTDPVNNPEDNIFFNKNGGPQVDISAAARAVEKLDDDFGNPFSDYIDGIATGLRNLTGTMLTVKSASTEQLAGRLRELSEMEEDRFDKEKVLVGSTAAQRIQMSQLEGKTKDEMIKALSDELKNRRDRIGSSLISDKMTGAFKQAVTVDIKELMSKVDKLQPPIASLPNDRRLATKLNGDAAGIPSGGKGGITIIKKDGDNNSKNDVNNLAGGIKVLDAGGNHGSLARALAGFH